MKTQAIACRWPQIRKTIALVSLSLLPLLATTPSLASHRHAHVAPQPALVDTQTDSAVSLESGYTWTKALTICVVVLLGLVIFLYRECCLLTKDFNFTAGNLRQEASYQEGLKDDLKIKVTALEERLDKESKSLASKTAELSRAREDLARLRERIEGMIFADPDIEKKAKDSSEKRARFQAEKEQREEQLRQQKYAAARGQEKISDLLVQMKRGY